jgi:hypothetical protein
VLCVLSLYEVSPSEVVNSFTAPKYPFSVLRGVFCQIKRLMKLLDAPDPFGLTPFSCTFLVARSCDADGDPAALVGSVQQGGLARGKTLPGRN